MPALSSWRNGSTMTPTSETIWLLTAPRSDQWSFRIFKCTLWTLEKTFVNMAVIVQKLFSHGINFKEQSNTSFILSHNVERPTSRKFVFVFLEWSNYGEQHTFTVWRHLAAKAWSCALFPREWERVLNLHFENYLSFSVIPLNFETAIFLRSKKNRTYWLDLPSLLYCTLSYGNFVVTNHGGSTCLFGFFNTSHKLCCGIS